jgi:TPR repeat protein
MVVPVVIYTQVMNQEFVFNDLVVQANDGDPVAQFKLGEFYRLKNGVGSIALAGDWFMKAAVQDYAPSQLALALLYLDGMEPHTYGRDARYWLQKAAQNGCQEASQILAQSSFEDETMDDYDLMVAAEEGDPKAQFELGCNLFYGICLHRDPAEGAAWIYKAALAGHAMAQCCHGLSYLIGDGIEEDYAEGIKWMWLSAAQGTLDAIYYQGLCHYEGRGMIKNDEQAAACLLKAAQAGHTNAEYMLANFYLEGIGLTQNFEQAQSWMQVAADNGHAEAKEYLNCMFG